MLDKLLCLAYRFAPEPFAERISLLISERRVARKWVEMQAKHIADGGVVAIYRSDAGEQGFLL